MKIFLSHRSALEFWRQHGHDMILAPAGSTASQASITTVAIEDGSIRVLSRERIAKDSPQFRLRITREKPPARVPHNSLIIKASGFGVSLPADVLCSKQATRHSIERMQLHTMNANAPSGSFIKVSKEVVVCSPELCFLQMATLLELPKLIQIGFEFCGTYSVLSTGDLKKRDAITSVQRLRTYAERMSGVHGHKKALQALRYIQDGSESPMETRLTILLTLPYKLGGYGLPCPELNRMIVPTKSARANANKTSYRCDLYWPEKKLDIEYDSDAHHLGSERIAADAIRRNALISLGLTVIVVTRKQFYDLEEFDKLARQIASKLERRLRYKQSFMGKHAELRKAIADD